MSAPASSPKLANPAVVGLAGFGLTTLLLQFHNVGWMGMGPVIWVGLIFGGTAQLIAGFQEMKTGNSFGYCAFTAYGAFWISLCLMLLGNHFKVFEASFALKQSGGRRLVFRDWPRRAGGCGRGALRRWRRR